jgi:hypothetical protein
MEISFQDSSVESVSSKADRPLVCSECNEFVYKH